MQKKTWIIGGSIVGLLVLGGSIFAFRAPRAEEIVRATVTRGAFTQSIDVTGNVEMAREADLAFASSGVLERNWVQVGDAVFQGQVLATLVSPERAADVVSAQAALDVARAGSTDEALAEADARVVQAQTALDAALLDATEASVQTTRVTTLAGAQTAEASLAALAAQANETQVIAEQALLVAQAQEDVSLALVGALAEVRTALAHADEVLGRENSLQNNACEAVLSRQDPTALAAANFAFDSARAARDVAEGDGTQETVSSALTKTQETLDAVARVLDATVSDTVSCSLDDVIVLKATISTARDQVQGAQESINAALQAEELAMMTQSNALEDASYSTQTALQAYLSAQISEENSIADARAAQASADALVVVRTADVAVAEAARAQVQASARAVDLAGLYAAVDRANALYAQATLVAPFSGVVTDIVQEVGEYVGAGQVHVALHASEDRVMVRVDVGESDIAQIALGDRARVTFDAFGDTRVFAGTVARIDPAETVREGVVYYQADVVLDAGTILENIRSAMSADVTIFTDERADVLLIPDRAVRKEGDAYVVRVITSSGEDPAAYETREVTLGLRGDGGMREILAGLTEGEEIVLSVSSSK